MGETEKKKPGRPRKATEPKPKKRKENISGERIIRDTERILEAASKMTPEDRQAAARKAWITKKINKAKNNANPKREPCIINGKSVTLSRLLKAELNRNCSDEVLRIQMERGYEIPDGWNRIPTNGEMLVYSTVKRALLLGLKPQDFKILCEVLGEEFVQKVEVDTREKVMTQEEAQAMLFGDKEEKTVKDVEFEEVTDDRE